jgi:hypothetical protein
VQLFSASVEAIAILSSETGERHAQGDAPDWTCLVGPGRRNSAILRRLCNDMPLQRFTPGGELPVIPPTPEIACRCRCV